MIEETFYVYRDNKTNKYLQYVYESGSETHLYLVDDFREATRVSNLEDNRVKKSLDWVSDFGSKMKVYISFSKRKKNEPFILYQSELELVVEKYCTQTIFIKSNIL